MNDVNYRQQMLDRALVAFDQAHARRRFLRRAGGAVASLALLVTAAVIAWPRDHAKDITLTGLRPPAPVTKSYPAFVEILQSDEELVEALDASGACEGVGREGGRVFIVECGASDLQPPA